MVDIISKGFGKQTGNKVSAIFAILLVIAIIYVSIKIYKGVRSGSKVVGDQVADNVISIQTGVSASRITAIRAKAQSLWDDSIDQPWYYLGDYDVHETDFIEAINSMANTRELSLLNEFYHQISSDGSKLKDIIKASFNGNEIARLNQLYYTFLKTL
jgi:hypothetical protein